MNNADLIKFKLNPQIFLYNIALDFRSKLSDLQVYLRLTASILGHHKHFRIKRIDKTGLFINFITMEFTMKTFSHDDNQRNSRLTSSYTERFIFLRDNRHSRVIRYNKSFQPFLVELRRKSFVNKVRKKSLDLYTFIRTSLISSIFF